MVRRLLGRRVRAVVLAPRARSSPTGNTPWPSPSTTARSPASISANWSRRPAVACARTRWRASTRPQKIAFTAAGAEIHFDALVIAVGAESANGLPGAITYRGPASNRDVHQAILAIDRGEISRLAFAVPAPCHWSLPLYELAIMAATHLADMGDGSEAIDLITADKEPLDLFGAGASQRLRAELDRVGVRLHTGVAPARMAAGGLTLMDGSIVPCDRAITLPRLEVAPLDGVVQGPHGFIPTDSRMRVPGGIDVYAVGDASWFPIKQGGLAAQQADVAATAIAAGIDLRPRGRPVSTRVAGRPPDRGRADIPKGGGRVKQGRSATPRCGGRRERSRGACSLHSSPTRLVSPTNRCLR